MRIVVTQYPLEEAAFGMAFSTYVFKFLNKDSVSPTGYLRLAAQAICCLRVANNGDDFMSLYKRMATDHRINAIMDKQSASPAEAPASLAMLMLQLCARPEGGSLGGVNIPHLEFVAAELAGDYPLCAVQS